MRKRSAYTLLELTLSLLLMSTLLGATWSLMGVFQNRLERSQTQTEQWQLVRSLQQTLQRDLQACFVAQDLLHPDSAAGSGSRNESRQAETQQRDDDRANAARDFDQRTGVASEPASSDDSNVDDRSIGEGTSSGGQSTFAADEWLAAETVLIGRTTGIIIDSLPPAPPEPPKQPAALNLQPASQSDMLPTAAENETLNSVLPDEPETAALPDVQRRVIYLFNDPPTAIVQDRPPGLIRCQLTIADLARLRQQNAGQQGLDELLRLVLPPLDGSNQPDGLAVSNASAASEVSDASTASGLTASRALTSTLTGAADAASLNLDLSDQIDYLPEVASLSFRYFDGSNWQSSWDSRREKRLPCAIELRFQLQHEVDALASRTNDASSQPGGEGDSPSGFASVADEAPLLSHGRTQPEATFDDLDPAGRSAQSEPVEDHRFLIALPGSVPASAVGTNGVDVRADGPTDSERQDRGSIESAETTSAASQAGSEAELLGVGATGVDDLGRLGDGRLGDGRLGDGGLDDGGLDDRRRVGGGGLIEFLLNRGVSASAGDRP